MGELSKLPNIGKVLEQQLHQIGVDTPEQLIEMGSKEAFRRIRMIDDSACIARLQGLEGAIQGIRWHDLPEETKQDLKAYFHTFERTNRTE
ncbi:TfoX/Sxy family protein [Candidatus Soleaferrea massiliensis]|uniref:TfoX/Sxy family protein n=1 Tax=Candidatus Soleaferrea massiliensis TaxID=1470354 RepID=UPI00058DB4EC|nr:TfoX/Sxy family protein [Candidatus Soleaferrea massiliensis]